MISQSRTYTAQDIKDLLNGDRENVCAVIAQFLNQKNHSFVGRYLETVIAELDRDQAEFNLQQYIASGLAAQERQQEAIEVQSFCY